MRTEVLKGVKKEIAKMLEAGFIRPCRYVEWISSIVPVQKKWPVASLRGFQGPQQGHTEG
jgi:hypothetical protein